MLIGQKLLNIMMSKKKKKNKAIEICTSHLVVGMKLNRNVSDTILVLQTTDRCLIVVTMTKRIDERDNMQFFFSVASKRSKVYFRFEVQSSIGHGGTTLLSATDKYRLASCTY